ncbi:unnamed protein product [Clonostachys rosea]|uniref:DUF7730 domain-containing protein n=1 Tax=Bionectria ochroleuca TaxID=29856 RepID=A0ABY6U5V0_BIOOC|nr:unnamed protein product [Clonostachys rosea]
MTCAAIMGRIPNRAMEKLKQAATLTEVAWRAARCSLKRRYNTSQNLVRKRRRQHKKRRPISRASSTASTRNECADPKANLFFTKLPWEIRRMIQVIAFGERTVHMDLSYRYPLILRDGHCKHTSAHARIHAENPAQGSRYDTSQEEEWRWFGCVCHRNSPKAIPLPFGRWCHYPWEQYSDADMDYCLMGCANCYAWPGKVPGKKCQIGILGWLLTCRKAYNEGTHILFGTNTIYIKSATLMHSLHNLIPTPRLSDMVSLHFEWDPHQLALADFLTDHGRKSGTGDDQRPGPPIFPALAFLRITLARPTYGAHDDMTGLVWPYENREELGRRLLHRFLPTVDALVCRIVPPSTEVTLSLSPWERYAAVDYQLVAIQGKERSKPRWSEFGGVKCWREIPTKEGDTPRGYWLHGYTVGNGPFPDENHGPFRNEVYKTGKLPPQTYERHRELSQDLWRTWEVDASET